MYSAQHWTLVFPLGMYAVATNALAEATGLKLLGLVSKVAVYVSLLAWILTFIGMLRKILKSASQPATPLL